MNIPEWFGKPEFYAIINLIYAIICIWFVGTVFKSFGAIKQLEIKKHISKFKEWRLKRKKSKTLY